MKIEKDQRDYLTIKIDYKKSISLYNFKTSIDGWYNQYNKHLTSQNISKEEDTLMIKEIKSGSIEMFLYSSAMSLFPHIETINTITTFFTSIKNIVGYLSTLKGTKPKYDIEELQNIKQIVAPITNNDNSISLTVNGNIEIGNVYVIDNVTAQITRKNADKEIKRLSEVEPVVPVLDELFKEKVLLKFRIVEGTNKNNKSTKGIIAEIDNKAHPIFFDEGLKQQIVLGSDNSLVKKYLVDVKIHKENEAISAYTILKIIDVQDDVSIAQSENTLFSEDM